MILGHGDDLYAYKGKIKHNFSSNILSGVDHSRMIEVMVKQGGLVGNYPQPEPFDLEEKLAKWLNISPINVMVTSGVTEAIYLLAHAFKECHTAIVCPTFREYEDACKLYQHKLIFWDELKEDTTGMDTVWICNPNNPTGKVIECEKLKKIIKNNPDTMFVLDQAYADYTNCSVLTPAEAVWLGNVALLGSFTKRFSVPGIRLGYLVGDECIIGNARDHRMPWSVSSPAIICADYLLDHVDEYPIHAETLHQEALRIAKAFRVIGIKVYDTDCNFILCKLPHGSAPELKKYLVENHGILIRDASNFRTLGYDYFRVAAQTPEENDLLISAVKQWITL
ncbi:MAG: aminotransferase class I/II-fold pyridoxal phosphate-dependent enzyme [Duncaniella sp.]|nr:aminotransferase class I/II-fold pyridoxal phosphate-dependent enzyme [Muribaculum sp.]MCM1256073.1 aminotransferase class I/II-fold pyridoxal phosphate-dependent enzyme [Duncaniella sp.]